MNRITIIQKIINRVNAKSYVEIGVEHGHVLFKINASLKYGIDPSFKFHTEEQIQERTALEGITLYQITSNEFFKKFAAQDLQSGIDVAFVDGLHTYKQSLLDVTNCLKYLNEGGVIIMHDCNPMSSAMAYPVKETTDELIALIETGDIPGWNYCWNGDVWKALVHLRIENDDLNIFTLDLDWGLGIISRGSCTKLQDITTKKIEEADYSFLEENRSTLLNLKHPKYIDEFLSTL